jgi:hypothetical protein
MQEEEQDSVARTPDSKPKESFAWKYQDAYRSVAIQN